ncbi:MAG: hypothetical protein GEV28_00150 [Actinophytocola sp.]|uniref:ester cyclase n=1 Tax=Actinophytocola sp. TaxID=1872138 RepID=UPI001329C46B|nr:ester cyclase [Actinophytocola sp.]MPZ78882.1 hypothetical protein [Actinophytocola sp.]
MSDDILLVMTRYRDLWTRSGLGNADGVIDERFTRHGSSGALRGVPAFQRYVAHYLTAFPDLVFTVDDWFGTRDRVVVRYGFTGTQAESFMGIAGTGKPVKAEGLAIYRVADRKLIEIWDYLDLFGLAVQLGAPLPSINPALSLK